MSKWLATKGATAVYLRFFEPPAPSRELFYWEKDGVTKAMESAKSGETVLISRQNRMTQPFLEGEFSEFSFCRRVARLRKK